MDRPTRAGVVEITSGTDVGKNLEAVERTVRQAVREGAELVVVPECYGFLGPEEQKLAYAEDLDTSGPILERMIELARETGAALVLGGHWERADVPGKVYNAC